MESVDPRLGERLKLKLPDNMEIETTDGEGKWLAGKIGESGKPEWAAGIVAKYLGIAYVGEKSKLGWGDRLMWWWLTRDKEAKAVSMQEKGWLEEKKAPDGLIMTKLSSRWETATRELFGSPAIIDEGVVVTVVNFTGRDGYGNFVARTLESMGMRVGMVKTGDGQRGEGCVVKSSRELKKSVSIGSIVKQWECKWQEAMSGSEAELDLGS